MKYEKIIHLLRPESRHPKMSATDRAAQFSAFAALVGLDEQMDETARIVDTKIELSEDESEILNRKIQILAQKLNKDEDYPQIKVIFFIPDNHKDGGLYVTRIGSVKRIEEVFHKILFTNKTEVCISDILDFEITE